MSRDKQGALTLRTYTTNLVGSIRKEKINIIPFEALQHFAWEERSETEAEYFLIFHEYSSIK